MINKAKRQTTKWEKIFAHHSTIKGLISKIHKAFQKLNNSKLNNHVKKWTKGALRYSIVVNMVDNIVSGSPHLE